MAYRTIEFSVRDQVASVVLNQPDRANAIDERVARELLEVATRCDESSEVRAILIRGQGAMFCGGGNLKVFAQKGEDLPGYLKHTTTLLHAAISRLARQAAPTVCAVHGFAAGGGLSLAISCDLVVAAETAKFAMAYTKAGLTPDGSSTYFLPRLIGLRRAMDMTLTNRVLTSAEALEWGLVSRVVCDGEVFDVAEALACQLASGPTWALGKSRELIHRGLAESLETQMELETRAIADAVRTVDAREGVRAFLEKRKPSFIGR